MEAQPSSPPASPTLSNNTTQPEKPTSIDLWNVPSLVNPSPPTNTLLITNLQSPHIFTASSLQHLYNLLNDPVPLNSFAPLPSLRRIIISYPTTEAAVATRQLLEQSPSLPPPPPLHPSTDNDHTKPEIEEDHTQPEPQIPTSTSPMRIYFGEPTPLVGQYASSGAPDAHLQAPSLGKLMFISPPPSPPCGWEIRDEDPPNKTTHAEDLLAALAGLGGGARNDTNDKNDNGDGGAPNGVDEGGDGGSRDFGGLEGGGVLLRENGDGRGNRKRRGTLTVYHPRDHGDSEDLPAVMVEDMTGEEEPLVEEEGAGALPTRTARPPVELMDVA